LADAPALAGEELSLAGHRSTSRGFFCLAEALGC